jgi:mono/diheme cytochrome c family protein
MMHKMKNFSSAVSLIVAIFAIGCASASNPSNSSDSSMEGVRPLPTQTVNELASGNKVFETNCAQCHKPDGSGGKVTVEGKDLNVEDLTSNKIKNFSDEKIIGYILKGLPDEGMPAFEDKLSEGEMRDVVLYIRKEFHGR